MSEAFLKAVQPAARTVFVFKVPQKYAVEGVESIGLVQLTSQEELDVVEMSKTGSKLILESILRSLVKVNGKKVSYVDGTADKAYKDMVPAVRQLVLVAYGSLHNPTEEDSADFLKSQVASVAD